MSIQVIEEGPRNLIVQIRGNAPETIVAADASPPCEDFRILSVNFSGPADVVAQLDWEGDTNVEAWTGNPERDVSKFCEFMGLVNYADGKTGNIIVTPPAAGPYGLVIHLKKVRPVGMWSPPVVPALVTETGDTLITEDGDAIVV